MNKTSFYFYVLLFLFSAVLAFPAGSSEKEFTIYYTSSLNGNLDGCKCESNPRAGLVKRAVFLRQIDKSQSILLDSGDIFDVDKDILLSNYILETYKDLGYDAIAVGDQELSNGADYLIDRFGSNNFLSNNLSIKDRTGKFRIISTDPMFITKNGVSAALISVISPSVFRYYPENVKEKIRITPVKEVLEGIFKLDRMKKIDLRMLIFHGSTEEAKEIGKAYSMIDIIISGHDQQLVDGAKAGNTVLFSPGREGNTIGKLDVKIKNGNLDFTNSFISFDYTSNPDDKATREKINKYISEMTERLKESQ